VEEKVQRTAETIVWKRNYSSTRGYIYKRSIKLEWAEKFWRADIMNSVAKTIDYEFLWPMLKPYSWTT